ncbi:MAG: hypothetical protein NZZ60_05420 [Bacteroidia bacterium]|nr:hypothetical protein [Bacteroidia bacterium]MCX7652063.1 hypothetical protein [Bacteroidia bacterium]MDW8416951.1 hypothetical protein [Bacteroidia bacterium]
MNKWLWKLGLVGLTVSCKSPKPVSVANEPSIPLKGSYSPCEELRLRLSPIVPPIQIPTGHSQDPFPSEVQDWLKKHLLPHGVYAPVGRWSGPESKELWLVEVISSEGASFYAILTDSTCSISDTALWAYQQVYPDRVEQASANLLRDGTCQILRESRQTEFIGDEPRTTTTTSEKRYQVDWTAGKLRTL